MLYIIHLIQYTSQLFNLPLLWHLTNINIKFTFLKWSIYNNFKTLCFFLFFFLDFINYNQIYLPIIKLICYSIYPKPFSYAPIYPRPPIHQIIHHLMSFNKANQVNRSQYYHITSRIKLYFSYAN